MRLLLLLITALFLSCSTTKVPEGAIAVNSPIIHFVDSMMGKKVGTGLCFDLIRYAQEYKEPGWYEKYWTTKELKKHRISYRKVKPGDFVVFNKTVDISGNKIDYHAAIVYKVVYDKYGYKSIIIAEQNICGNDKKDNVKVKYEGRIFYVCKNSKVVLTEVYVGNIVKGKVLFYRF